MQNTGIKLDELKNKLLRIPCHKLDEVDDFLGFILSRHRGDGKKNIWMQGIWTGKVFDRLDIDKEMKSVRKDPSKSILKRVNRLWIRFTFRTKAGRLSVTCEI